MRVVIELKRGEVPEIVLNNLYKQTPLQDSVRHQHGGAGRRPAALLNLKEMLDAFLRTGAKSSRAARVRAAQGARARPHPRRPGGGAANIDEIIALIKASPSPPRRSIALMARAGAGRVPEMLARAGAISTRPDGLVGDSASSRAATG
jgi:DNA gyrase subunit A